MKLEVGQKVTVMRIGNAARNKSGDDLLFDETVTSVKKKYFTLSQSWLGRFRIDSGFQDRGEYCPDHQVYESRQVIADEIELKKLIHEMESDMRFSHRWLSLDDVKTMHEIMFRNKPKD